MNHFDHANLTVSAKVIRIINIHSRMKSGVSRPFVCGGNDGENWVVKSPENASYDALIREFLVSSLAGAFHLPVVDFSIVDVPETLINLSRFPEANELGSGLAFGSKRVEFAGDLRFSQIVEIPETLRGRLLFFDWWTQNLDRQLTSRGGNPNLLFDPRAAAMRVIDHDNALDPSFIVQRFSENHAFREDLQCWRTEARPQLVSELDAVMERLTDIWHELPDEWLYDKYGEPRRNLTSLIDARNVLSRYKRDDHFWKLPGS